MINLHIIIRNYYINETNYVIFRLQYFSIAVKKTLLHIIIIYIKT